jgi:hypothetical protein
MFYFLDFLLSENLKKTKKYQTEDEPLPVNFDHLRHRFGGRLGSSSSIEGPQRPKIANRSEEALRERGTAREGSGWRGR